ncbi:MAG: hypothetical protein J6T23_02620 [Elusimicrobia bacterium]|nr:hypothetical protein [Elusimicrobiota bacterium]
MKIGDYVRTDTGIIEKLEGIHEQNKTNETITKLNRMGGGRYAHILDINSEFAKEFDKNFSRGNIIKSRPNIMDLIEENDYIRTINDTDFRRVYMSYGKLVIEKHGLELSIKKLKLAEIITSQQFPQMKYKVESEVN